MIIRSSSWLIAKTSLLPRPFIMTNRSNRARISSILLMMVCLGSFSDNDNPPLSPQISMLMLISPGIIAAINFPIEVYFSWVRQIPFLMMNRMTIKNLQVQETCRFCFPLVRRTRSEADWCCFSTSSFATLIKKSTILPTHYFIKCRTRPAELMAEEKNRRIPEK